MSSDSKPAEIFARYPCATVDELIAQYAHDVSEGGMLLRSSTPLAVGKLIDFEVQLADEKAVLNGAARIAWKRDAPDGERPAGVAVKFVDLDEASQALVDRLVAARKEEVSEFDRAPPAPAGGPAKTVLGLGSAFGPSPAPALEPVDAAPQVSAEVAEVRTKLGVSAPFTEEEAARAVTSLGLAPASVGAKLVLAEPSSPELPVAPPGRAPATSDIDDAWVDDPKPREEPELASAAEVPEAASVAAPSPKEVTESPKEVVEPSAKAVAVSPARAAPARVAPPPEPPPGRGPWIWVAVVVAGLAAGVYLLRDAFQEPDAVDAPPASTTARSVSTTSSIPTTPTVAPTAAPAASAASAATAPSATPAVVVDSPPPVSVVASAQPEAGKSQAPAASAKTPHPTPSAKPRPKPKPKPPSAEDNPY